MHSIWLLELRDEKSELQDRIEMVKEELGVIFTAKAHLLQEVYSGRNHLVSIQVNENKLPCEKEELIHWI